MAARKQFLLRIDPDVWADVEKYSTCAASMRRSSTCCARR
jgi:hypothetical protein